MRFIVLALAAIALAFADDQAQKLIDRIDSLQAPLEDLRCEFEGDRRRRVTVRSRLRCRGGRAARVVQRHVPLEKKWQFLVR